MPALLAQALATSGGPHADEVQRRVLQGIAVGLLQRGRRLQGRGGGGEGVARAVTATQVVALAENVPVAMVTTQPATAVRIVLATHVPL